MNLNLMKSLYRSKLKWAIMICVWAGIVGFIFNRYNAMLWVEAGKFYDLLQDRHRLKEMITSFGPYSPLIYMLVQVLQVVAAPIPGGAVEFLGGYLFGVKAGLLYSMIGSIVGSWFAFGVARLFKRWAVEKFVSSKTMKKYDYLTGHEGAILIFLLFLIPGFPKDALCYILGLTPMHLAIFLIISSIGRIPGTLMATLQGAKAFEHQYKLFLILSGVSALVILVFYIYHEEIHGWIKKLKEVRT
jgi:uncharacterized membrane protein YdjX (TVP38/TMEM64 family)